MYFYVQHFNKEEYHKRCKRLENFYIGRKNAQDTIQNTLNKSLIAYPCTKCNDTQFHFIKFTTNYTSINISCSSCNKNYWIELKANTFERDGLKKSFGVLYEDRPDISEDRAYVKYYEDKKVVSLFKRFDFPADRLVLNIPTLRKDQVAKIHKNRKPISSRTKQSVWQRDMGRCVECGSKEKLEYDHIIPVSKGGSNTMRNVQLLCERCNRQKGANIV